MTKDPDPRAVSALRSVFPDTEAFDHFKRDCEDLKNQEAFTSILDFAYRYEVIAEPSKKAMKDFLKNEAPFLYLFPDERVTLSDLLGNLPKYAKINIPGIRSLVNNINAFLKTEQIKINKLDEAGTIFNRIKSQGANTPRKRHVLRCVALYLGFHKHDKPEVLSQFHFYGLSELCRTPLVEDDIPTSNEGVRVFVNIYARGDLIERHTVEYLFKKADAILKEKPYKPSVHDITTFSVYFPLQIAPDRETSHPFAYGKCINDAVSFAYQLYMQWTLSPHQKSRRLLSIAIDAGTFSKEMDSHLDTIIRTKIQDDPVIRLTDFARQCALANDLKITLCPTPLKIELTTKEIVNIWWLDGFFSMIYEDFIPDMLSESNLPHSITELQRLLVWYHKPAESFPRKENTNAILSFFQNAQNSFFGLEIAKVLFYRKQYFESNEALRIILSLNPKNLVARTLRIMIFWNLGLEESSYDAAKIHFERSEEEARFAENTISEKTEEFYCEWAVGIIAHACSLARRLHAGESELDCGKDKIQKLLRSAEKKLLRGITISPTGYRSIFWFVFNTVLSNLLKNDPEIFQKAEIESGCWKFNDQNEVVLDSVKEIFRSIGWLRENFSEEDLHQFVAQNVIQVYDASVSLRAYRPTLKYAYALFFWDFNPRVTVGAVKQIFSWLHEAKTLLSSLTDDFLYLYTCIRFFPELIHPDDFAMLIDNIIREINSVLEKNRIWDLNQEEDDNKSVKTYGLNLCLLHLFTNTNSRYGQKST